MSMTRLQNVAKQIFVDSLKIRVQGGTGGHGLPQFGGIGGKGGDVYIKGSRMVTKLNSVTKKSPDGLFKAGDGQSSRRTRLVGDSGRDLIIKVPLGVTVEDFDRQLIGEINSSKDQIIVALGGRGGEKHNDNQGFKGQKRGIRLDLKMISDVAFVGFPNAGKSSLLRAVSRATPKVANYPFTTLKPNLGVVQYPDFRQISMADLPGLVEGAHKNLGLGYEFLKHIERTKLLIFMIDINNVDLGPAYAMRSPLETLCILNKEIELYDDSILNKPAILAVSKMDSLEDSQERYEKLKSDLNLLSADSKSCDLVEDDLKPERIIRFDEIIPISSHSGLNIDEFKQIARSVIDKYAEISRSKNEKFNTFAEMQPYENNRISPVQI